MDVREGVTKITFATAEKVFLKMQEEAIPTLTRLGRLFDSLFKQGGVGGAVSPGEYACWFKIAGS